MNYHFRNLVFEGGGVKGVAYAGALEELEAKGILPNIKRVGGTSAGAITATLVALNYSVEEIRDIVIKQDFEEFLDDSFGYIRDIYRIVTKFGWCKGDRFREWIGKLIGNKTGNVNSTFNDIIKMRDEKGFRELYIIGTNLSTGFAEVFSFEHTPRMCIADAVRISMSIPFIFVPPINFRNNYYCDGGLMDNYPVKLFDREKYIEKPESARKTEYYENHNKMIQKHRKYISPYVYNKETLGFRLDTAKEIAVFRDQAEPVRNNINNFFDFTKVVILALFNIQESMHLHSDDWQRTIYIDTKGVKTTDFSLDMKRKKDLINAGKEGVKNYFNWFDDPNESPINRI